MGKALTRKLLLLTALLGAVILTGTSGYALIEGWPLFDSLYMTVITLATIGYGETHPLSQAGRAFTIALVFFGTGVVGYALSSLTLLLFQSDLPQILKRRAMEKEIARLQGHIIVCGLSHTGLAAIDELTHSGHPVVAVERDEAAARALDPLDIPYIVGDATEDANLTAAGALNARALISCLTSDAENAFVIVTARTLNPQLMLVAKAETEASRRKLLAVGAHKVVVPSYLGGVNLANLVVNPETLHFFERLHTRYPNTFRAEVVPVHPEWDGKQLGECLSLDDGRTMVIALETPGEDVLFNPGPATRLQNGASLMIIGRHGGKE
ncbi:potassium channel family protein [Crenobacter caeni]|uniref:Potassium channel family protein n=1 Tax=Crenobacter caeni TaxID=2705474 RepID=A0A6B2KQE6_9NEIS|nr:potassium channel family protein [Crenobacter caeni]NDV12313.1 potassium channel family protein [Crenobacter caeni]